VPKGTVFRVLSRKGGAKARVLESVEICRENLKRIMDAVKQSNISVPLGVSVECVSKYRDEFEASVKLFSILQKEF